MYVLILILKIILIIFLVFISLLILILSTPFYYYLAAGIKDGINGKASVSFMFGLLKIELLKDSDNPRIRLFLFGICILKREADGGGKKQKKEKKQEKKEKKAKKEPFKLPDKRVLGETFAFAKEMLRIIKPKSFKISVVYGLNDPSITGIICAVIPIIKEVVPLVDINFNPTFEDEIVEIETEIIGKFVWMTAIFKFLRFVLKKDIRKIIFRKSKKVKTIHQTQVY